LSKIIKQRLEKEKRYTNLSHSLKQANIESRTVVEELSNKEPYMAIKDGQADNKISNIDSFTPLKVRPIRYKRYVDRYVVLVKKQEALNHIINQEIILRVKNVFALDRGLRKLLSQKLPVVPATRGNNV
jgi:hypothetical protein